MLAARLRVAERILALHEMLHVQATYDGLTGLLNRTAITKCLDAEIERAMREDKRLSVVLLDLDHFKQVNDLHGHAAGDAVLKKAAERLQRSMRAYDQVGRYGGEEFLIVAPACRGEDGFALAERVRNCIGGEPVDIGGQMLAISCSLGAAVAAPRETGEALIGRADAALYRAKANGRNRTEMAGPTENTVHQ